MANKGMSWTGAVRKVLEQAGEPLHYTEITERIIDQGLRTEFGATPAATVSSVITTAIKNEGDRRFKRIGKGIYGLATEKFVSAQDDDVAELGSFEAFGVKWKRDQVIWATNPELFGRTHPSAAKVNIADQQGIYLLHDETGAVVYVGQATTGSGNIGKRLSLHTKNRLKARWERFSWFGIRPVSEQGKLGSVKAGKITPTKLITTLEALLIEVLEPRQNRATSDNSAQEYIQVKDDRL